MSYFVICHTCDAVIHTAQSFTEGSQLAIIHGQANGHRVTVKDMTPLRFVPEWCAFRPAWPWHVVDTRTGDMVRDKAGKARTCKTPEQAWKLAEKKERKYPCIS